MSYIISINQNFARTLDEQAALRLAELSGTFAAFKYNLSIIYVFLFYVLIFNASGTMLNVKRGACWIVNLLCMLNS